MYRAISHADSLMPLLLSIPNILLRLTFSHPFEAPAPPISEAGLLLRPHSIRNDLGWGLSQITHYITDSVVSAQGRLRNSPVRHCRKNGDARLRLKSMRPVREAISTILLNCRVAIT